MYFIEGLYNTYTHYICFKCRKLSVYYKRSMGDIQIQPHYWDQKQKTSDKTADGCKHYSSARLK